MADEAMAEAMRRGLEKENIRFRKKGFIADLLFAFDAIIPKINGETAPILEEVLEAQRRIEREKMAERVRMTAIKALDELPGLLENTAAVMEALTPVRERKLIFHRLGQ